MKKMRVMKDKRGVELTLNTVIISILVLLVLVVVIGFFLGGTGQLKDVASDILRRGTAGTDVSIASEQCKVWCAQFKSWPGDPKSAAYCSQTYSVDFNQDGELNIAEKGRHCFESEFAAPCYTSKGDDVDEVYCTKTKKDLQKMECTGTADGCSGLSETVCVTQKGCAWTEKKT